MEILATFINILAIVFILVMSLNSYRSKNFKLRKNEILFKKSLGTSVLFSFIYIILFICMVFSIVTNYSLGILFISCLTILNVSIHVKLLSPYFCIYKKGLAILNSFNEVNSYFSWSSIYQWYFDKNKPLKVYIIITDVLSEKKLITFTLHKDEFDIFRILMMRYVPEKLIIQ